MLKKFKRRVALLLALVMVCGCSLTTFAADTAKKTATIYADFSDANSYRSELETLLADESIEGVYVLQKEMDNSTYDYDETLVSPNATTTYRYRITNVKTGATNEGSTLLATAKGTEPGMTLSITTTKSVSYKVSNSVTVSNSIISAGLGFDVTGTESIAISCSQTIPATRDGKKVASMTLKVYPTYQIYTYTIQRHKSIGGVNYGWSNYGTGTCERPIGFYFTASYTYK